MAPPCRSLLSLSHFLRFGLGIDNQQGKRVDDLSWTPSRGIPNPFLGPQPYRFVIVPLARHPMSFTISFLGSSVLAFCIARRTSGGQFSIPPTPAPTPATHSYLS